MCLSYYIHTYHCSLSSQCLVVLVVSPPTYRSLSIFQCLLQVPHSQYIIVSPMPEHLAFLEICAYLIIHTRECFHYLTVRQLSSAPVCSLRTSTLNRTLPLLHVFVVSFDVCMCLLFLQLFVVCNGRSLWRGVY